jgi:hypothetical protein
VDSVAGAKSGVGVKVGIQGGLPGIDEAQCGHGCYHFRKRGCLLERACQGITEGFAQAVHPPSIRTMLTEGTCICPIAVVTPPTRNNRRVRPSINRSRR